MEKKNTILLTVIAIATLLVAVVGATFAYFTANVNNATPEADRTDSMRARTLVTATMELGTKIDAKVMLPGFRTVRSINIKGTSEDATSTPVNTEIVITPDADAELVAADNTITHAKYYIFKVENSSEPDAVNEKITCNDPVEHQDPVTPEGGTTVVQHYMTTECGRQGDTYTAITDYSTADIEGTFVKGQDVTVPVTVSYGTNVTYYVVYEYENDSTADQNTEQGHKFTATINFREKATTPAAPTPAE